MNRFRIIIKIIIILFLVGGAGYAFNRLDFFKKQTKTLTIQKTDLIEAKEYLEQSLETEKKGNSAKSEKMKLLLRELAGLQDTKRIKEESLSNQKKLQSLSFDYSITKQKNLKLQQSNASLNHRLAKLTNEFTKTLEEVNSLQTQVNQAKSDKFVRKFMLQLKKAEAVLEKREKELKVLKEKNKNLSSENSGFNKEKRIFEKNALRLEKENARLETLVDKIRKGFNERIAELDDQLLDVQEKARQIRKIEQARDDMALELKQAQEKMKNQEQIIARLEAAQKGISVNEIPFAKSGTTAEIEGDLSKAYALYDTAKAQVVKFSEMLMSKEVEIETSKKKIAALEEDLKLLRLQPEASGDKKYAILYDRIKMLNESLLAKDKVLQEKEYKNANTLYSDLKSQLLQSTELLARRESEVIEKNKEVLNLKSELIIVQAEYNIKEQELKDLRMQQNKTLEDMSRITNLNISLQQNAQGHPSGGSLSQEEKRNADKLKKEIEALLGT